jgi:hypothetical protein
LQPGSPAHGKGLVIPEITGSENIGVNFSLLPTSTLPEPMFVMVFAVATGLCSIRRRRR